MSRCAASIAVLPPRSANLARLCCAAGDGIVTELTISNQRLPDTLITALPGRSLRDVIGYDGTPAFFASRFTTIVEAEMSDLPFGEDLQLILAIKWHLLSRVLPHLR